MTNAVIYARYSSDKQTEQSIEGQLRVCREYAQGLGYAIVGEYIDRALSGTTDNRPSFLQMVDDSKQKQFEFVIVYKLDRFARSKYDSVIYKHKLQQNGVRVISATEAISDTPEGKLVEGLLEMFAEMYSTDLSQKTKRGMKESVLKGNTIGGQMLYGYTTVDKKIVIDEFEANVIRQFFELFAAGKTKKEIAQHLNAKGYLDRKGKPFTHLSFQMCLTNKKYIGLYDNGIVQNKNYYPRIISEDLFFTVQAKLAENKHKAGRKANVEYLLSGKVFCGKCGATMVGVSGYSKIKMHCYYSCSTRWTKKACDKSNEKKEELEESVVQATRDYVLSEEGANIIAKGVLGEYKSNITVLKIKEFEKRVRAVDAEIEKCFKVMLNATSDTIIKRTDEQVHSLEIQKNDLMVELKKLQLANQMKHSEEDVRAYLAVMVQHNNETAQEYNKRIIEQFVNSVYVFDDKINIFYDFENGQAPIVQVRKLSAMGSQFSSFSNIATYFFALGIFGVELKR